MKVISLFLIGLCWLNGLAWAAPEAGSRDIGQADRSGDRILERVVVPSAEQPQGEVRLLQRGDLLVVQTLLASRVLKRVVAAIDGKEQRNWPETSEGYLASSRYRDELFRATEKSWQVFRQRTDRTRQQQTLAIEFILGPETSMIALSLPTLAGAYGELRIVDELPVKSWRVNADYVRNNMVKIIADSFRLDEKAAEERLKHLWPQSDAAAGKET